ncbi:MAG: substrate-binding domain-containing protein [Gammaproteobacteria bacterium]|nr:substrate-binding domain-containing protein [Gammaproteobacteria bacterium]
MPDYLDWPIEAASQTDTENRWCQPESNICLDFHGDPIKAGLVVFSDGNHHMALEACLRQFRNLHPEVNDVFYATTPPGVIVNLLKNGQINLGNLTLSRLPNVFISPQGIMDKLQSDGYVASHQVFMQSRGNVLLVRKNNPKNIQGLADLLREDIKLFISNPNTEKASYQVYEETLLALARQKNISQDTIRDLLSEASKRLVTGQRIHHREAPQRVFDDSADVAIVYYHLALRYTRIFPEHFDIVPLSGLKGEANYTENNICTAYHVGSVGDGGTWGQSFVEFMFSDTVTSLYAKHGLQRP